MNSMADKMVGLVKKYDRIAAIKAQMAAKYERKANVTKSQPQRMQMSHRAARLRRQAIEFTRLRDQLVASKS